MISEYLQGDDDTFAVFPEHVRVLIGRTLPAVRVTTAVYPRYETRGDLKECVGRFQEWYVTVTIAAAMLAS